MVNVSKLMGCRDTIQSYHYFLFWSWPMFQRHKQEQVWIVTWPSQMFPGNWKQESDISLYNFFSIKASFVEFAPEPKIVDSHCRISW